MGSVLGAAVRGYCTLEPRESWSVAVFAAALLALALVAVLLPRLIAYPIAVLSGVTGGLLLLKAVRLCRDRSRQEGGASYRDDLEEGRRAQPTKRPD
jgi:cardiolipin synthase A/B